MKEAVQQASRDEFRDDVWELLRAVCATSRMGLGDEERGGPARETLTALDRSAGRENALLTSQRLRPPSRRLSEPFAIGVRRRLGTAIIERAVWRGSRLRTPAAARHREVLRGARGLPPSTITSARRPCKNMLALALRRDLSRPIWNRQFVGPRSDHRSPRTLGIEGRAGYYEQAGAIRDIFQNHIAAARGDHRDGGRRSTSLRTSCATRR